MTGRSGSKMIFKLMLEDIERPFAPKAAIPFLLIQKATDFTGDGLEKSLFQPSINTYDRFPGYRPLP